MIRGATMAILILIGASFGALLGLRFKVFVLVPVTGIALGAVALGGLARAESSGRTLITMIVIATVLQLGYVLGSFIERAKERSRIEHRRYSVATPVVTS